MDDSTKNVSWITWCATKTGRDLAPAAVTYSSQRTMWNKDGRRKNNLSNKWLCWWDFKNILLLLANHHDTRDGSQFCATASISTSPQRGIINEEMSILTRRMYCIYHYHYHYNWSSQIHSFERRDRRLHPCLSTKRRFVSNCLVLVSIIVATNVAQHRNVHQGHPVSQQSKVLSSSKVPKQELFYSEVRQ